LPELPDLEAYLAALEARTLGTRLERIRLTSPFLLRSVSPTLKEAHGRRVVGLRRLGKRLVFDLEEELFLVLHLMIAGRLQWKSLGATPPKRSCLAAFDFQAGTLILTEAGSKKRASLHLVEGVDALAAHDPGGVEPLQVDLAEFRTVLERERHTLKRSLTDPHLLAGIGNAYSDEILHRARLSPFKLSDSLSAEESERLFRAIQTTLEEWIERLKMAVHGRYGKPCPECEAPVQRILYAETEANYCARCQTEGRLLADRVLSRLLKQDWPKSLEELEQRQNR
jgi:formamidopyrimidine-DNA glycosylase